MSLKEGEMHTVAAFGTLAFSLALVIPSMYFTSAKADTAPPLEDMEAIEASIAVRKKPAKQPQKKFQAPTPEEKPVGVSRDENKPPEPPKPPEDKKPPPKENKDKLPVDPLDKFRRPVDDEPVGKPTDDVGEFNDNERGFADETKGDPFFQRLARDVNENWSIPTIVSTTGAAVGCVRIEQDGKISAVKVDPPSGDSSLDTSVEQAMKAIKKIRSGNPEQVPTHLLKQATTKWICFKFEPKE